MTTSLSKLSLDKDGYLVALEDWSEAVAVELAKAENLKLTEAHWAVIHALRQFYKDTDVSPANRPLVRLVKRTLGADIGNSIALMQLFGERPALTAAKVAGLPRPPNCL